MREPFQRIRGKTSQPSPQEILEDLVEFHTARPGITEATLGECTTLDGRTGYDVLVECLQEDARRVLDLGAGNGPLLERLLGRRPKLERVVGVDACASELELARVRARGDARVELLNQLGQHLDLPDACLDAVLSHHAFYLMRPIEAVVAEVARILRPGGLFALVTWSARASTLEPFAELMRVFSPLTARDNPHFSGWGDPRAFSLQGLESLLVAPGYFAGPLGWDEHDLLIAEAPEALSRRLMGFFYSAELGQPETQAELHGLWCEILSRNLDSEGRARLAFPFACVRALRLSAADGA
ncbi:MAG: class I SAM-dependent methyltransferase [Myxococcales bacterium]|nr:class I SAM-dependent methyltransferase [Myxococcales bacterium]